MKRPMKRYLVNILVIIFVFIFIIQNSISVAFAQDNISSIITTSPIFVNLETKPSSQISTVLEVQNNSSKAITIKVKLEEFKANGNSGQAQIYNPPINTPSLSWVHFSKSTFTALPNVWNSITMTINLPKTASLGYYYAVLFSPQYSSNVSSSARIKGANAILVLLDAKTANNKYSLAIKSFTSIKTIYQYLPASFRVDVANNGNIFTSPQGDVYISKTINGPSIATIPFNSSGGNILPNSDRVFNVQWTSGFPVYQLKRYHNQILTNSNGIPQTSLHWNFKNVSEFRIGKYYAHLVLVYNNGIRDISAQSWVGFWVLPWIMILIIIIILAILALGIWTLFKPFIKRALMPAKLRSKRIKRRS